MALLRRIGLLLATTACIGMLAEGVTRALVSYQRTGGLGARTLGLRELGTSELAEPNLAGLHTGVPYRTNSNGLRGPDYDPEPAPGTLRILVSGDSVTAGWGVPEDETYPALLSDLLASAAPDHPASAAASGVERIEVINAGLPGANGPHAVRRLRQFTRVYDPHLAIYGFTLNDIEGAHYRSAPPRSPSARAKQAWRRALRFHDSPSHLLRELWPRLMMLLDPEAFKQDAPDAAGSELHDNYFENDEAWTAFAAAFDMLAAFTANRGICGHVFVHTRLVELGEGHPNRDIYARVGSAARERGLSVTDSFPSFSGRRAEDLRLHAFDVHPSAEGHEILARSLYEGLRALPPECFRAAHR
jgi:lysophospholipase L1-like esterase